MHNFSITQMLVMSGFRRGLEINAKLPPWARRWLWEMGLLSPKHISAIALRAKSGGGHSAPELAHCELGGISGIEKMEVAWVLLCLLDPVLQRRKSVLLNRQKSYLPCQNPQLSAGSMMSYAPGRMGQFL